MAKKFDFESFSPMTQEIVKVSLGLDNPMEEFGPEKWLKDLVKNIEKWVTSKKVSNVEYFVSTDQLEDLGYGSSIFTYLTGNPINYLSEDDFQDIRENIEFNGGPGWDGIAREETTWNDKYLYTGSDGSFYIIVRKA